MKKIILDKLIAKWENAKLEKLNTIYVHEFIEALKVIQSEHKRLEEKIDELIHDCNESNKITDDLFAVMQQNDLDIEKRIEVLEGKRDKFWGDIIPGKESNK